MSNKKIKKETFAQDRKRGGFLNFLFTTQAAPKGNISAEIWHLNCQILSNIIKTFGVFELG